jgi:predicted metal-dependent enzyme (double-stranded beta helix superfamily)
MLEQRSEAGIDKVLNIAGFDASLANLESSLGGWISRALAAPDLMTGLSLLRQNLEKAIFEGRISLPDRFRAFRPDHYARRLIFADHRSGVSVLAMVWAPGQGTPLHDHSGLWGVEAVLAGEIETVPFELTHEHNGQYFFEPGEAERVTVGSTGYLMPPFEHHITRNVSSQVAITLNIYAEEMSACNIFLPTGSGSYTRERRLLSYND